MASEHGQCAFGTDCADCGVRIYCVDCPQACQDQNLELTNASNACLQSMWSDSWSDSSRNRARSPRDIVTVRYLIRAL